MIPSVLTSSISSGLDIEIARKEDRVCRITVSVMVRSALHMHQVVLNLSE